MRRVLGLQHSGGTLTSAGGVLRLLGAQYRFFVPSVLLGLAAFLIVARRVLRCYRARNWEPAQGNALLFSWLVTGIVVFGLVAQVPAVLRADPDSGVLLPVDRGRPLGLAPGLEAYGDGRCHGGRDTVISC